MIPQETIDRIREATDIVEVVSKYVTLKPSGRGFKGLCPFHGEKTPSFHVNPERQFFHCFGCHAGGNVYHFVMRIENQTFLEAVEDLAKRARIAIPSQDNEVAAARDQERQRQLAAVAWAAERFTQALAAPAGRAAREYLRRRGVPPEWIGRFGLGYAPAGWDALLRAAARDHYAHELLVAVGLALPRKEGGYYDRFRDRVMFPIRDPQGRVLGFGGRLLGQGEPKYLNSPESGIFHKGELLFGLDLARETARRRGRLVLVEGYMDAVACHAAGVTETVAGLGTALTPAQAHLLRRVTENVIVFYDADAAGTEAALRSFEVLRQERLQVKAVSLTGAKDPDEYIQRFGAQAFAALLDQAGGVIEYVYEQARRAHDAAGVEGKVAVLGRLVPFIARLENPVERQEYVKWTAERLRLDEDLVAQEVRRAKPGPPARAGAPAPDPPAEPAAPARPEERQLLGILLRHPAQLEKARAALNLDWFADASYRDLAQAMAAAPAPEPEEERGWLEAFLGGLADPGAAERVAELAAEQPSAEDPGRVLRDCLARLEAAWLRGQIQNVQWQMKDAQQSGQLEAFRHFAQQEMEWKNRLKKLGVDWRAPAGRRRAR